MGKYLRIRNRGECPRLLLQYFGVSGKRERMGDDRLGGWYGSDTNFCPIAALRLGIEVRITSRDERGPYLVTYRTEEAVVAGKTHRNVIMDYGKGMTYATPFTTDSAPEWSNAVGDDDKPSYLILRGYMRNAVDEDKDYKVDEVDAILPAVPGETWVYLTATDEFRHLLKFPERYFKWHSDHKPVFDVQGTDKATGIMRKFGAIWPKSEDGAVRMFSQGSLAFCQKDPARASLYDYGIDLKERASEQRGHFKSMLAVMGDVCSMFSVWRDVDKLVELIVAIEEGRAGFESDILALNGHLEDAPKASDAWLAAWERVHGAGAVIAFDTAHDELARQTYAREVVRLESEGLRSFLLLCGVKTSKDVVPEMAEPLEYSETPAERLKEREIAMLLEARAAFALDFPETAAYAFKIFVPLTERMRSIEGFASRKDGGACEVWIQRACLRSRSLLWDVIEHECRHARTKSGDHDRAFVAQADVDLTELRLRKHGLEPDARLRVGILPLRTPDEWDELTDPDAGPAVAAAIAAADVTDDELDRFLDEMAAEHEKEK